ncbi:MAG: hypothetical protein HFP76_00735, partial [Methylococcales symbiont of Iophon sp. n. MRB-2018]
DYKHSSASHHLGVSHDKLITDYDIGVLQNEYQDYLQSMIRQKHIEILQRNTHKGLPCGGDNFIKNLSDKIGRDLSFKGVGRPKKG